LEAFLEPCDAAAGPALGDRGHYSHWWLRDFSPRKGYVGAVAVRAGKCRLRYWKLGRARHGPLAAAEAPTRLSEGSGSQVHRAEG
jgi:hypothetical protein